MSLAELVPLLLKTSIVTIVFALGLSARPADLAFMLKQPGLLVRSLLAMSIVMPLLAFGLVRAMDLPRASAIMLVALSLAPVPPILPRKQLKAGGHAAYAIGLLIAVALIAIVWIPVALHIAEHLFGRSFEISSGVIAELVAATILLPLVAGVIVAWLAPALAVRFAPILSRCAGLLLLAVAAVIMASQWRAMIGLLHQGTFLAMAIFVIIGLAVGHALGGPVPEDRTILAMATASRHPGVALAIARINFPEEKTLIAAVLLFLLINIILSIPYIAWRKRLGAAESLT